MLPDNRFNQWYYYQKNLIKSYQIVLWKVSAKFTNRTTVNAKRNLLWKIIRPQTLKLLNEYARNLLLKIIRTTPQASDQVHMQSTFKNYPYHLSTSKLFTKCIRNLLLKIIRTTSQPLFRKTLFQINSKQSKITLRNLIIIPLLLVHRTYH